MSGPGEVTGLQPTITVVIPVYNESDNTDKYFKSIVALSNQADQVIIVDGNSVDGTYELLREKISALSRAEKISLYQSKPGRARQMNVGTVKNTSDAVIFLHFDTILPASGVEQVRESIRSGVLWGRFDVELDGKKFIFRVIEKLMNYRSVLTNIATGDQAIFVRRDVFKLIGGYPELPLMEDIALSKNLKEISAAKRIESPVLTSSRRWQSNGVWKTIVMMWSIRLAYWSGIKPERLARWYRKTS